MSLSTSGSAVKCWPMMWRNSRLISPYVVCVSVCLYVCMYVCVLLAHVTSWHVPCHVTHTHTYSTHAHTHTSVKHLGLIVLQRLAEICIESCILIKDTWVVQHWLYHTWRSFSLPNSDMLLATIYNEFCTDYHYNMQPVNSREVFLDTLQSFIINDRCMLVCCCSLSHQFCLYRSPVLF